MLEDIAILTGGRVISEEVGLELKEATLDMLGSAKSVKVQKENTIIVDGLGDKDAIQQELLRSRLKSKRQNLISTEKNCRSVLQNCPAALQ